MVFVSDFKFGDKKYICADVETNKYPETLTLIVESVNNYRDAYAYESPLTIERNQITFYITNNLPPGKYRARILYARDTLAYILFSVGQE